jgi:hypothetical protein
MTSLLFIIANFLCTQVADSVGTVVVNSMPTNAEVFLDDINTGFSTPCTLRQVNIGMHTLAIKLADYAPWRGDIDVTSLDTVLVNISLFPITRPLVPKGPPVWMQQRNPWKTALIWTAIISVVSLGGYYAYESLTKPEDSSASITVIIDELP